MTWDDKFAIAEKYYKEHGNLRVPLEKTHDGFNLYRWIVDQRRRYRKANGQQYGDGVRPLTEEQIRQLESIGMLWNPYDEAWERSFAVAEQYYREHGNLEVPKHYEVDGFNLSHWIWTQRRIVNGTSGEHSRKLTEEQIRRLEEIGMDWAPKSKGFYYYYNQAKKFYDTFGHTDFPDGELYINGELLPEKGESLNAWKAGLNEPRADGRRNPFEVHRKELCEIGINPTGWKISWERYFDAAEQYYQKYGNLLISYDYQTEDGMPLGKWISRQRMSRNGTSGPPLAEERIRRLEEIGMIWNPPLGPHRKEFRIEAMPEKESPSYGASGSDEAQAAEKEMPPIGARRRMGLHR